MLEPSPRVDAYAQTKLELVPSKIQDHRFRVLNEVSSLVRGIGPGDCARLASYAHFKRYKRGEMLCLEGENIQQVLLLTRGVVKITQLGMRGSEVILKLAVPGDLLGTVGLFSNGKHGTTAQAFRSCEALMWEGPVFRTLVGSLPALKQNIVRVLVRYTEELEERFREVATERVAPRVARQLVRLAEQIGQRTNGAVDIALSRLELAQMTGTTLFTVSRLLSGWEACGYVIPRREAVSICELESLRALADEEIGSE
jgi:CRP/FNR family transcriptional regulator, nitrogen oxide reductase regulator